MSIMKGEKILILGGDERLAELSKLLRYKDYTISTYGHENLREKNIKEYESLEEAIADNKIIIGPVPFNNGQKINMKLSNKTVLIDDLVKLIKSDKMLYLGYPDKFFIDLAASKGIQYQDYNIDENYQIYNAAITAEGAISIILKERNITIHDSRILLLGYGRIGKILSDYLKVFNDNLYVAARKNTDITWININGCKGIRLDVIDSIIEDIDLVINTIPFKVLSYSSIDKMDKNSLIIDLASKPGGLDHDFAREKGIKTIHALGLPGKTAPKSAAKAILDTILALH
ncbi:MAG: dipicolinate synthase subunit DpsA [Lutispora sp.]|jgi:dipicolinate synthase subunit A